MLVAIVGASGKLGKCVKDKVSKKIGYGPTCLKKMKPKNKDIME